MFGWKSLGSYRDSTKRYGLTYQPEERGSWVTAFWGNWRWAFVRYSANRFTGPEENRSVLAYFLKGPDRRKPSAAFKSGFARSAAKPLPSILHNDTGDECNCASCRVAELKAKQPRYAERP